jgi:hypothetical protein
VIPAAVTRAVLAVELPAAAALCARRSWRLDFDSDKLELDVWLTHPVNGQELRLRCDLTDYREVPPAWRVVDPTSGDVNGAAFPQAGSVFGQASIFHPNLLICAPWNRLAYSTHGGVHGDWGEPALWLKVDNPNIGKATTITEMLSVFSVHLACSPGFM